MDLRVTAVRFVPAAVSEVRTGLLGYVGCTLQEALRLDGLTLRRTAAGVLTLSYPARTDRDGRRHPYVRPVDDAARLAMESLVLGELRAPRARP